MATLPIVLLAAAAFAKPGDIARSIPIDGVELAPAPAPPPAGSITYVGGDPIIFACWPVDYTLVDRVVKQHINQVRYCYERRLPQRPTLEGEAVLRFTLDVDGTLLGAQVAESTLDDEAVEACLVARFTEWEWPKGNSVRVVRYPLQFSQKPDPAPLSRAR